MNAARMSRQQRRAVEKQQRKSRRKKSPAATATDLTLFYHFVWALALRDLYGFGDERLTRSFNKVMEIIEDIGAGRITMADVMDGLGQDVPGFLAKFADWEAFDD